jgi:hypothetical protein
MLNELMLRNDLTHAEHRVLYLLYAIRANSATGLCFTTDKRMAEDLGLTVRSIERTKASLKAKGLLAWQTDRLRGTNNVCVYRLQTDTDASVEDTDASVGKSTDASVAKLPTPASAVPIIEPIERSTDIPVGFEAKFGSPELAAWDRWSRKEKGRGLPRNSKGGWHVPSQWPPKRELTIAEIFDL